MASLTGQQIIDKFNGLVDDELEATLALQLVNDAKDEVETELKLHICQANDTSKTASPGDTYLTAKAMPSDFLTFAKPYIYVGTYKYYGVPLADKMKWKDTPYKYFYDPADGIHLCGTQNSSQTISIPYIKSTPDVTLSTSPIWPSQFHAIIPLYMAMYFYPIDGGDKSRSWSPEWAGLLQRKMDKMIDWDMQMKIAAMGGRAGYQDDADSGIPLGQM
ncbi:MAG: hypothetical protein M1333_00630 [Patescibacteria group bacterium]|nr:hypothetical protein [Patescibacteria group bacterium]